MATRIALSEDSGSNQYRAELLAILAKHVNGKLERPEVAATVYVTAGSYEEAEQKAYRAIEKKAAEEGYERCSVWSAYVVDGDSKSHTPRRDYPVNFNWEIHAETTSESAEGVSTVTAYIGESGSGDDRRITLKGSTPLEQLCSLWDAGARVTIGPAKDSADWEDLDEDEKENYASYQEEASQLKTLDDMGEFLKDLCSSYETLLVALRQGDKEWINYDAREDLNNHPWEGEDSDWVEAALGLDTYESLTKTPVRKLRFAEATAKDKAWVLKYTSSKAGRAIKTKVFDSVKDLLQGIEDIKGTGSYFDFEDDFENAEISGYGNTPEGLRKYLENQDASEILIDSVEGPDFKF